MADFDLTQTDAQVQSILNDAQNAQGAGAQTTLTTDYIMLKDTSGNYHKILKDSFTEACRNVLAGLLVNNDKGTTISQIPAIASGDLGSVTPANLASVLGARYPSSINATGQSIDANNFEIGKVYVTNSANESLHHLQSCFYNTFSLDPACVYRMQIAYGYEGTSRGKIWQRSCINGSWSDWYIHYNYGCNTLAELKAALAAV